MRHARRKAQWGRLDEGVFDVAVVGGGINGASVYHQLCSEGYRVLLVDKADFAGGTSQASAMFIWGGLLYLRNLEFRAVARFCRAREQMVRDLPEWVRVLPVRYMPSRGDARSPAFVLAALYLYWLLGAFRRSRPRWERDCDERALFGADRSRGSMVYEEAHVVPSDVNLVLHFVLSHQGPGQVAINYCCLKGGVYDWGARAWRLELSDGLGGRQGVGRARLVVNAAGVWTDRINDRFGIQTAFKHVLSKGVFIGIPRDPRLVTPLIIETRQDQDCMSLIPWGPVALWGPTETIADDPESGFRVDPEDIRLLLDELNRNLARQITPTDVVCLRCGVRPLAVKRSFTPGPSTLGLSKDVRIERDRGVPWVSVYGGKITGCLPAARTVARLVREVVPPTGPLPVPTAPPRPAYEGFPGLAERVVSARFAAEQQWCWTLEDYLRRRSNISQWVARGGLGRDDENIPHLLDLARAFTDGDEVLAQEAVDAYRKGVDRDFDRVLASSGVVRA